jgi:O-antigen/teichoic acid export membrane protein
MDRRYRAGIDGNGHGSTATATTGASVLRGGLWYAASFALPQLYTLVVSVAAARALGTEGMGRQSFISFVELSAAVLVAGGLPRALVRTIGEQAGRDGGRSVRALVRWSRGIVVAAAALGGGAVAVAGLLRADLRSAWLLAAVACAAAVLHHVPAAVLSGLQRWRQAATVSLVTGAAGAAATVAVLVAGGGIVEMFLVEAAVTVVNLAWTEALARRALAQLPPAGPAPDRGPVLRYAGLGTVEVVLALVVWRRSEFLFLDRYASDTELALYSVAFAATAALARLPEAVASVVTPAVATLVGAAHHDRIRAGFGRSLRLLCLLTLPLTAIVLAAGPALLRVVYGDDYAGTGRVLVVMMVAFPAVPLLRLATGVHAGFGRIGVQLSASAAAAAVDVGLAALLVPAHGAEGAAVANAAAQVVAAVPIVLWAARITGGVDWAPATQLRVAAASVAAGLVAWAVVSAADGPAGVVLAVAAGSAAFLAAGVPLRVLSADDAAWVRAAVRGGADR